MTVPSTGRDETYGWLGQFPQLREWLAPRHVHSLKAHSFTISNRSFESTVAIKRDDISDDTLGMFKPSFSETEPLGVPPDLEDAALRVLNTKNGAGSASNPWQNTADLIVTPFVTG